MKAAEAELHRCCCRCRSRPMRTCRSGRTRARTSCCTGGASRGSSNSSPRATSSWARAGHPGFRGRRAAGRVAVLFPQGRGAELHWAVLRLAMDMMVHEKGFTPMTVPVLVREKAMQGTGFFPAGREQAYRVGEPEEPAKTCLPHRHRRGGANRLPHAGRVRSTRRTCRRSTSPSAPASAARRAPTARTPPACIASTSSTSASRSSSAATTSEEQALAPGDARLQRGSAQAAEPAVPRDPVLHRRHRREERAMMDVETWMPSRDSTARTRLRLRRNAFRLAPVRIPGPPAEPPLQGQGRQAAVLPHAEQHRRRQPAHPDPDPGELPERRRQRDGAPKPCGRT